MIYKLKFRGLDNVDCKETYESEIDNILDSAPSDSSATSYVRKLKSGYAGILHIFSSQGRFVAKAVGKSLDDLTGKLKGQMKDQIENWQQHRFQTHQPIYKEAR